MIAFILFVLIGSAVAQFCQSPVCTQEPVFTAPVDGTSTTIICNDPVNECLGCCKAYTISKGYSAVNINREFI
ncbi:hypothetical protein Tcan_09010 [Toxocara canis]|uniref:Secreted protein n=1 Tax=Toxocara canis TaxID=6265 RepID=A0A0B2VL83_TOXCA|nr:hypothetical protein Tcan_09010 [Toxocara canis]